MDFNGKSSYHVRIEEAVFEVRKVKVATSEQLHLEKVLMTSGAKYPLAHVVTRHFTLAAGASTANVDALFTGQIPTKVIIGLVNNEAFVGSWNKSPFNSAHMDLNQACLVVDRRPLPAQPWQPDFTQGLYAETYHALLKSAGMYPSDWSNGLSAAQFVGGTMLLSWDLTPDESDGTAYLSPRPLGTVKASLRFAKPLPAKTTLLAYAQYDKLVIVDAYRTVTFDYNAWCSGGNFRRPSWESPRRPRHWLVSTPGKNPGPFPSGSRLPTWSTRLTVALLGDSRHAEYFDSYGTAPLESIYQRLRGMGYRDVCYSMKMLQGPVLEGLRTLGFLFPGHAEPRCALGGRHRRIQRILLPLQWGRDQTPPGIGHTHIHPHIYSDSDHRSRVDRLSTPRGYSDSAWTLLVFIAMDIIMLRAVFGLGI